MAIDRRDFIAAGPLALGSVMLARRAAGHAPDVSLPSLGADRLVMLGTRGGPAIQSYAPSPSCSLLIYFESNRYDIETRIADEGRPDLRRLVAPHE
jgi:hypothetical protein